VDSLAIHNIAIYPLASSMPPQYLGTTTQKKDRPKAVSQSCCNQASRAAFFRRYARKQTVHLGSLTNRAL